MGEQISLEWRDWPWVNSETIVGGFFYHAIRDQIDCFHELNDLLSLSPTDADYWVNLSVIARVDLGLDSFRVHGPRELLLLAKRKLASPASQSVPVAQARRAFLRSVQSEQSISSVDIERAGGPTYKTIEKWADGYTGPRTAEIRGKIARALSLDISRVPE